LPKFLFLFQYWERIPENLTQCLFMLRPSRAALDSYSKHQKNTKIFKRTRKQENKKPQFHPFKVFILRVCKINNPCLENGHFSVFVAVVVTTYKHLWEFLTKIPEVFKRNFKKSNFEITHVQKCRKGWFKLPKLIWGFLLLKWVSTWYSNLSCFLLRKKTLTTSFFIQVGLLYFSPIILYSDTKNLKFFVSLGGQWNWTEQVNLKQNNGGECLSFYSQKNITDFE